MLVLTVADLQRVSMWKDCEAGGDRGLVHVKVIFPNPSPRGASSMQASYEAGDHVGILAQNEDAVVQRAATALGLSPSMVFSLQLPAENPHQLSLPFTGGPLGIPDSFGCGQKGGGGGQPGHAIVLGAAGHSSRGCLVEVRPGPYFPA